MLKFNVPAILIVVIFAYGLTILPPAAVASNELDIANIPPSSAVADDDSVTLRISDESQQLEDLYQRCAVILGDECIDEIVDLIFEKDSFAIISHKDMERILAKNCCGKLVNMGRQCHDHMVNIMARTLDDFSTHSSPILPRSSRVWELCSLSST